MSLLDRAETILPLLGAQDIAFLQWQTKWTLTARPEQLPPEDGWTEAGFMAGRGFGKTRVGAEWMGRVSYECPDGFQRAVVAPTQNDARFTCFEGESGLLSVIPPECIRDYNRSDLVIYMHNGASIRGFSAEKADRLRGPQFADAWCDELAAWGVNGSDTWDMLQFCLRLGPKPRVVWTTTPKPVPLVRKLVAPKEERIIVRGSTYDNKKNLPKSFFDQLDAYEGTKLGRQELHGELIDPEEAGIVRRSWLNLWPANKPLPKLDFIIMSLDTAFTEKTLDKKGDPDPTACGVWGIFHIKTTTHVILLDCWEEHLGFPELMKKVKREANTRYGDDEDAALIKPLFGGSRPITSGRKPDMLLIEDKGSGISLRQSLSAAGIDAYAYNPGKADKLARLHIVSPIFAQRRVWVPESDKYPGKPRTWCESLIGQLCSFVGEGSVAHDDHVDQTTQALRVAMDKGLLSIVKPAKSDNTPPASPVQNPYAQ